MKTLHSLWSRPIKRIICNELMPQAEGRDRNVKLAFHGSTCRWVDRGSEDGTLAVHDDIGKSGAPLMGEDERGFRRCLS